jgi:hypothetical protein
MNDEQKVCHDCKGVNLTPEESRQMRRMALCATCRKPVDPYARIPKELLNPRGTE